MTTPRPGDRILVTGGSGYIASHIVAQLLERGFEVRATVRDPADESKTAHLKAFEGSQRLELVAADLTRPGDFEEPVRGCAAVIHTASSVRLQAKDPQRDIVDVALQGTRNVFDAVDAAEGVHKVVVTSSIAAVMDDTKDPSYRHDEDDWNESSTVHESPYPLSKTLAEKEVWKRAESSEYQVVTLNPALVLGPVFTKRHLRSSAGILHDLVTGKFPLAPRFRLNVVDVRDVARAHLEALIRPGATGRHILSNRGVWLREMSEILRAESAESKAPRYQMPNVAMYVVALFDERLNWNFLRRNLDVIRHLDNSKSKQALGIDYMPIRDTIIDTARSFDASPL